MGGGSGSPQMTVHRCGYVSECCEPVAPGQGMMPELSDGLETGFISGLQ